MLEWEDEEGGGEAGAWSSTWWEKEEEGPKVAFEWFVVREDSDPPHPSADDAVEVVLLRTFPSATSFLNSSSASSLRSSLLSLDACDDRVGTDVAAELVESILRLLLIPDSELDAELALERDEAEELMVETARERA